MRKFPELTMISQSVLDTTTFLGYDHNLVVQDGAMYDMRNMTGDLTPVLASRPQRGLVAQIPAPHGLAAKDGLCWISGTDVYMNGLKVEGVQVSEEDQMLPKQLVSMGAYLVIWPDKIYINTQDLTDVGRMDASFTSVSSYSVTMCRGDGTDYDMAAIALSDVAPDEPGNGAMWIDTSGEAHVLMQYSEATDEWVQVATTFVKVQSVGLGASFKQYDGVEISGIAVDEDSELSDGVKAQLAALNGSMLLYEAGTDYVVLAGMIDQAVTIEGSMVTIRRVVPDMDYITECDNRLWGCKYGMADGQVVNELYACALGDFRNWRRFMGISTDSYTASVGTDGRFTGAATVAGCPVFFKENCLHKVIGVGSNAYQITSIECRGVQEGCGGSLCTVNETLFYKARTGVMTYDGSMPSSVSAALGTVRYDSAVAGSAGEKYYISMRDSDSGEWALFAFSTKTGMWHREDETQVIAFAQKGGELYFMDSTGRLMAEGGMEGELEGPVAWMAETGTFGYAYENHKYLSRFNIRAQMEEGAEMALDIQYDSDGIWRQMAVMKGTVTRTFMVPVIPRRCDHLRLRLRGQGQARIYSLARILEIGGDG